MASRLVNLGAISSAGLAMSLPTGKAVTKPAELLGANASPVRLSHGGGTPVEVKLHPDVQNRVAASLKLASTLALPDELYLKLENVRGTQDATVLRVYIDLPPQADAATRRAQYVGSVGLFGLRRASVKHGAHGGSGLSFILDISRYVDKLYLENKLSEGDIQVSLVPSGALPQAANIEVGRVSIYRQPN
jgi:tyrosinase